MRKPRDLENQQLLGVQASSQVDINQVCGVRTGSHASKHYEPCLYPLYPRPCVQPLSAFRDSLLKLTLVERQKKPRHSPNQFGILLRRPPKPTNSFYSWENLRLEEEREHFLAPIHTQESKEYRTPGSEKPRQLEKSRGPWAGGSTL